MFEIKRTTTPAMQEQYLFIRCTPAVENKGKRAIIKRIKPIPFKANNFVYITLKIKSSDSIKHAQMATFIQPLAANFQHFAFADKTYPFIGQFNIFFLLRS